MMRAGGLLKLAVLLSVFLLAVFLGFQLLEVHLDFNLAHLFTRSAPVEVGLPIQGLTNHQYNNLNMWQYFALALRIETSSLATKPSRYKCGLSKPCPEDHLSFKMASGAASVVGPKICLDDNILMSGVKNNVGRGMNIALVNGKTGELVKTDFFDMWAGDVNTIIQFLKSIEDGTIVMMATFDDSATKLNDEAKKLIADLGSSHINSLGFRDNWIFVGGKGIKTKSPFEQYIKNNADTNKYEGWPEVLEMEGCIPRRQD